MWFDTPCKISRFAPAKNGRTYFRPGNGRTVNEARYILKQKLGREIKDGYECCHHCDVPNCIEPEHLWEGTRAENERDAWRKGRKVSNFCKPRKSLTNS